MEIHIDLLGCADSKSVLLKIGEVLQLGGPDGNHPVEAVNAGEGWGVNWDALNDSLSSLDEGGIWGNSKKPEFPLNITFENYDEFSKNDKDGFKILKEICKDTSAKYKKDNLICEFTFA
jgi:hypothetical protein